MSKGDNSNEGRHRFSATVIVTAVALFMILSASNLSACTDPTGSDVTVTFVFVDHKGRELKSNLPEVYVNHYGYKSDGESITCSAGATIYYRA